MGHGYPHIIPVGAKFQTLMEISPEVFRLMDLAKCCVITANAALVIVVYVLSLLKWNMIHE